MKLQSSATSSYIVLPKNTRTQKKKINRNIGRSTSFLEQTRNGSF
jgi:hypothetical protein